jgi:hypothetical protein
VISFFIFQNRVTNYLWLAEWHYNWMSLVPPSLGSIQLDEEINNEVLLNPVRGFQACATPIAETRKTSWTMIFFVFFPGMFQIWFG